MTPHARVADLVVRTVCDRLQVPPTALAPTTDLRTLRTFSSFVGIDILERLEAALEVEVPADLLTAERLCSVASLTDLLVETLGSGDR